MGNGPRGTCHSVSSVTASAAGRSADAVFGMPIRFVGIAGHGASQRVVPIANAALRIGRRRASLHALAIECALPDRTLQWRLKKYTRCSACDMLAYSLLAHAAWDLEREGWNVKRIAGAAGFGSREAFTNYVRRHLGLTPRQLSSAGATRAIVDSWLAALNGLRNHVMATAVPINALRDSL